MKSKKWLIGGVMVLATTIYAITVYSHIGNRPDKIWLHRCNSIEKLREFRTAYPNVEADIMIRPDGTLDVTHDADTTFHQAIDDYFPYLGKDQTHIWLDIKNLTTDNAPSVCARLDSLCSRHNVSRRQLIIESSSPDALSHLTARGYYTSYYVSYDKPSKLSDDEIEGCIARLQTIADSRKVRALSFPGWWYATIKSRLNRSIDLLTWKHRTTEFELLALPTNRKMLDDPQLKVILIKAKGHHHR